MKNMYQIAITAITAIILMENTAVAGQAFLRADVTRVFVDEAEFGGCMAEVVPGPSTTGLNCPDSWVTFSCLGQFNPKSVGNQKLAAAQLAMVAGTQTVLKIDDSRKHNNYCYVTRIDNTTAITP